MRWLIILEIVRASFKFKICLHRPAQFLGKGGFYILACLHENKKILFLAIQRCMGLLNMFDIITQFNEST